MLLIEKRFAFSKTLVKLLVNLLVQVLRSIQEYVYHKGERQKENSKLYSAEG